MTFYNLPIFFDQQHHDVAILVMDSPVTYTENIRSICLASGNNDYAGEKVTVSGWGLLRENGPRVRLWPRGTVMGLISFLVKAKSFAILVPKVTYLFPNMIAIIVGSISIDLDQRCSCEGVLGLMSLFRRYLKQNNFAIFVLKDIYLLTQHPTYYATIYLFLQIWLQL